MIKLVVTGPESSGKTSLAKFLAQELQAHYIPEYAREHLKEKKLNYDIEDVITIAIKQIELEEKALTEGSTVLVCDTDVTVIKIWTQVKFGFSPTVVQSNLSFNPNAFYLLCKPNIPWENDELRENPNDRDELFILYKDLLDGLSFNYEIVDSLGEERFNTALNYCKQFLQNKSF
ncbi:MAG: AAA family ATPase [Luteibaculaceae bacterium]